MPEIDGAPIANVPYPTVAESFVAEASSYPARTDVAVHVTTFVRSAATSSYVAPVPTGVAPRVQAYETVPGVPPAAAQVKVSPTFAVPEIEGAAMLKVPFATAAVADEYSVRLWKPDFDTVAFTRYTRPTSDALGV